MDANTIVSLVGSLGFPIVCCGILFYQQNKTIKEFSEKVEVAVSSLSHSIENNTKATTELVTTVEVISKFGGEKHG